jgi:YD repeat-containing protein
VGNLTNLRDPVNNDTSWTYDHLNRVTAETNELSKTRSFAYDATGNLLKRIDRNGRKIEFVYDGLHRRTHERWGDDAVFPSAAVSTTTPGGPAEEVERVGFTDAYEIISGDFTLTYDGQTTGAIDAFATASQVQAALEALSNLDPGEVAVTKIADTSTAQEWRIIFQGALAGTNVAQTTIDASGVWGYYYLQEIEATDVQGAVHSEVQSVTLSNTAGGAFTLSFAGQTTAAIAYNATASQVETAGGWGGVFDAPVEV